MDLGAELAQRTDDVPPTPPSEPPRRPRTRGECIDGPRPCPWVSCSEHLLHGRLARTANGIAAGQVEGQRMTVDDALAWLDSTPHTCTLDVADAGGATLAEVADVFGVTRERIRQIETKAQNKIRPAARARSLATYLEPDTDTRDPDSDASRPRSRGAHTTARPVEDTRRVLIAAPATWTGPTRLDVVPDATATRPDARRFLPVVQSAVATPDESPAAASVAVIPTPDEVTVPSDSEPRDAARGVADDEATPATSAAPKCVVGPCQGTVAAVRSDTIPSLRECCRRCRTRGHTALRDKRSTPKSVVAYLTDTFGRTGAAVAIAARATSPAPRKPAPPVTVAAQPSAPAAAPSPARPAATLVERVRDGQRALALAARVGGLDALEQLVAELEGLR